MKKTQPTRRRDETRRNSAAFGDQLREWLQAQQVRAAIRRRKRRKEQPTTSRGVDRVPKQYRIHRPAPEWVVLHTSPSRSMVRHSNASRGRVNQPHTNPMRDVKALRSGRLRKELRP